MTPHPAHADLASDSLREAFVRHTREMLAAGHERDDTWRRARACLHERGFDLRRVEHFAIGYFPAVEPVWQRLLSDGFSADELRASNLLADSRLPGRLVGPIRDSKGRIVSFWAKQPENLDRSLYLSADWKEQAGLFGLDLALPAVTDQRQDLLIVEDIWDALLLHSHACHGVGAIGNSPAEMCATRWERLDELGIHRVTLLVDSFHESHEAAVAAIWRAATSRRGPAIYVLPPAAIHGAWQSWQQGRTMAAENLQRLLAAHRIHGFHYLALGLIALAKGDGPWTDDSRRAALAEGRKFYGTAHQRNVPQLDAFFLPPLLEALGLGWSDRIAWSDAWLEDGPSSNGSAANGSAGEDSEHHVMPAPAKAPEHVQIAAAAAEESQSAPAVSPTEASLPRRPVSDYCDFHQCERIVCLCWD